MKLYNIFILAILSISIAKTNSQGQINQVTFENRTGQPLKIRWLSLGYRSFFYKTVSYSPLKSDSKEQTISIPRPESDQKPIIGFRIDSDINTNFPECKSNRVVDLEGGRIIRSGQKYIISKRSCIGSQMAIIVK